MFTTDIERGIDSNLYSRQLPVYGFNGLKRISITDVLIVGLKGVGVEIAKNIILSGVRSVTIHDEDLVTVAEITSQFYLAENDIGRKITDSCVFQHLAALNPKVKVSAVSSALDEKFLSQFKVVILTDGKSVEELIRIDEICRKYSSYLVVADTKGVFGVVFCDFGDKFIVDDKDTEEPVCSIVTSVTKDTLGLVTLHDDSRHKFVDGDFVKFTNVKGMIELNSYPGQEPNLFRIIEDGAFSFYIGDTSTFSNYLGGGTVTQVKVSMEMNFIPLQEAIYKPSFFSTNDNTQESYQLHIFYQALLTFQLRNKGNLPKPANKEHAQEVVTIAKDLSKVWNNFPLNEELIRKLASVSAGTLSPLCSVIGGIASQEVLKACSGVGTPINQWFYFDAHEVLLDNLTEEEVSPIGCRYDSQIAVFGRSFQDQLVNLNCMLIGSGTLGCEYLKNFAMMGVGAGSKGSVTVTDFDVVQKCNLNTQFLFRSKDIGKMKSLTAATAVKEMNPGMNIKAVPLRVELQSETTFNDSFWESLDIICNAVDNVNARCYVSRKSTFFQKPVLESGISGTKGNVQVTLPHLTETYACSRDPPDKSIPISTLRSFPYHIEHTIQWAADEFEERFNRTTEILMEYVRGSRDYLNSIRDYELVSILRRIANNLAENSIKTFEDCIRWARLLFQEYYVNNIQQLLFMYPLDTVSNGDLFWSGRKQAPSPLVFNPQDPTHMEFIIASSFLKAQAFGIQPTVSPMEEDYFRKVLEQVRIPKWHPKIQLGPPNQEAQQATAHDKDPEIEQLLSQLPAPASINHKFQKIDFNADEENLHVSWVHAASNLKAQAYNVTTADRIKTKCYAGRICPSLITANSMIVGLACIEFYKMVQKQTVDKFKNSFVNLAIPFLGFSQPVAPVTKTYNNIKWSVWDKIMVEKDFTLDEFIQYFKTQHNLNITGVVVPDTAALIWMSFMSRAIAQKRMNLKITELATTIAKLKIHEGQKYIALEVTAEDENNDDIDMPTICMRI